MVKDIYPNFNQKKYDRLHGAFLKWKATNKANSTIIGETGSGKTSCALIAIEALNKAGDFTTIVSVPTKVLKLQWEKLIEKAGLKNVEVYVVNTLSLNDTKFTCDFLIVDEVDKTVTSKFKNVYRNVVRKWVMNLTATLFGEKRNFIAKHFPIADQIEMEEALEEGYVSNFTIYNLGLEISYSDCKKLDQWQSDYFQNIAVFGDYDNYRKFLSSPTFREQFSNEVGIYTGELFGCAKRITNIVNTRKKFFYTHPLKLETVQEIREMFPEMVTVIFSENIDFMESVVDERAIKYHSKMSDKQREKALDKLVNKENKINCIIAGKAVEAGLDVGGLTLGVNTSYTSSQTSMRQKIGRTIRVQPDGGKAIFINLYLTRPDRKQTPEEKNWLIPSLVGREKYCKYINSLEEIEL